MPSKKNKKRNDNPSRAPHGTPQIAGQSSNSEQRVAGPLTGDSQSIEAAVPVPIVPEREYGTLEEGDISHEAREGVEDESSGTKDKYDSKHNSP